MPEETVEEYQQRVAKAGGEARKKQHPNYSKLGKKGMKKRWKKRSKLEIILFD